MSAKQFTVFSCMLIATYFAGCGTTAPATVVKNGDVEFMKEGKPIGWIPITNGVLASQVKLDWDATEHHNGARSLSIEILKTHPAQSSIVAWQGRLEGFKTNSWYQLETFAKGKGLRESAWLEVQCWNKDGKKMLATNNTRSLSQILDKREWEKVALNFRVPRGTASVLVRACVNGQSNQGGKVWFDDFKLWTGVH